jgi:hypothetical protein
MPEDSNKKMDDLLKRYARERRRAPELNLHPATRKLLQSEVARVFGGRASGASWFHRIRNFWPQLAFAGSLCLILGIAVLSLRQPPPAQPKLLEEQSTTVSETIRPVQDGERDVEPLLKKAGESERRETEQLRQLKQEQLRPAAQALEPSKEAVRESLADSQAPAPTTLPRDSASVSEDGLAGGTAPIRSQVRSAPEENVALKDQVESKAPAVFRFYSADKTAAPQSPAADPKILTSASPTPTQAASPSLGLESVPGVPPANIANIALQLSTAEKLSRANELTNLGAARRLQFVRTTETPASAPVALFTSFQMEQLGRDVRFFDNDGSVYFGIIEQPTNAPASALGATTVSPRQPQRLREQPSASAATSNVPAFIFTAQGTNRTLGKNVVLTGQYFEQTNPPSAVDTLAVLPRPQTAARGVQAQQAQHVIIGTAVIGSTNQVPVRAVSRE